MDDRRKYTRIDDRNSVAVTVVESEAAKEIEGQTFFCLTENISEGGIMLHVGTRVPEGSVLKLRIAFAHPIRSFDLTGRVVWIEPPAEDKTCGLGVEFLEGKANDFDTWREIVRRKVGFRVKQDQPESSDEQS
jgi:Tfp pilus assembly protein PilZ